MRKKPAAVEDYIELGQFYLLNHHYEESIKQFKLALKIKPDAQVYFQLGLAYETSCKIPEAKEMYRKAIELDPNHKEANVHLSRLTG